MLLGFAGSLPRTAIGDSPSASPTTDCAILFWWRWASCLKSLVIYETISNSDSSQRRSGDLDLQHCRAGHEPVCEWTGAGHNSHVQRTEPTECDLFRQWCADAVSVLWTGQ